MTTRSISTLYEHSVCDLCGRTLLRGEHIEAFLGGGRRYEVCELCKSRALHEGWIREGAVPDFPDADSAPNRRGSLIGRLRSRSSAEDRGGEKRRGSRSLDDELAGPGWDDEPPAQDSEPEPRGDYQPAPEELPLAPEPDYEPEPDGAQPDPQPSRWSSRRGRRREASDRHLEPTPADDFFAGQARQPRQVHAIPSDDAHKFAAAVGEFNNTEHCRTIAGVARSLGGPTVSVSADASHSGSVWIVASWELCWYRYEVDISSERANVRLDSQGYELDELPEQQRARNGVTDANGRIALT